MPPHHAPLQDSPEGGCSGVSSILLPRLSLAPSSAAPCVSGHPAVFNYLTRVSQDATLGSLACSFLTSRSLPVPTTVFPLPRSFQARQNHFAPLAPGSSSQGCLGAGALRGVPAPAFPVRSPHALPHPGPSLRPPSPLPPQTPQVLSGSLCPASTQGDLPDLTSPAKASGLAAGRQPPLGWAGAEEAQSLAGRPGALCSDTHRHSENGSLSSLTREPGTQASGTPPPAHGCLGRSPRPRPPLRRGARGARQERRPPPPARPPGPRCGARRCARIREESARGVPGASVWSPEVEMRQRPARARSS